eukprot:s4241_g3.t1
MFKPIGAQLRRSESPHHQALWQPGYQAESTAEAASGNVLLALQQCIHSISHALNSEDFRTPTTPKLQLARNERPQVSQADRYLWISVLGRLRSLHEGFYTQGDHSS